MFTFAQVSNKQVLLNPDGSIASIRPIHGGVQD
jgi:hypothetical protein